MKDKNIVLKKYKFLILIVLITSFSLGCIFGITINNTRYTTNDFFEINILQKETNKRTEKGIDTYRYCYYDELDNGSFITNPEYKLYKKEINFEKAALLIIDPWCDSPFEEVNNMVNSNIEEYILPIVESSLEKNATVMVFTNNPEYIQYDTLINKHLQEYIDKGLIECHYYDEWIDSDDFSAYMNNRGFNTLIYTGYAIEMCVGYRNCGVVSMYCSKWKDNFERFIIPEGCLAMLTENDTDNIQHRNAICTAYSQQGVANLILFEDFIK